MSTESSSSERRTSPLHTVMAYITLILMIAAVVSIMLVAMGLTPNTRLARVWDAIRDATPAARLSITATPNGEEIMTATAYANLVQVATAAAQAVRAPAEATPVVIVKYIEVPAQPQVQRPAQPAEAPPAEATPAPLVPIPQPTVRPTVDPGGITVSGSAHVGGDGVRVQTDAQLTNSKPTPTWGSGTRSGGGW